MHTNKWIIPLARCRIKDNRGYYKAAGFLRLARGKVAEVRNQRGYYTIRSISPELRKSKRVKNKNMENMNSNLPYLLIVRHQQHASER